jgi:hypothetical protein
MKDAYFKLCRQVQIGTSQIKNLKAKYADKLDFNNKKQVAELLRECTHANMDTNETVNKRSTLAQHLPKPGLAWQKHGFPISIKKPLTPTETEQTLNQLCAI